MTGETLFVFLLLLTTIILFVSDRLRLDVVAVMVILALMLSGLLSPREALAGFADPVVLLIAGLFVVGEGLFRTGVALAIGNWLTRVGGTSETRMMILLMLVVAGLSAFMSSTGAVAIFYPGHLKFSCQSRYSTISIVNSDCLCFVDRRDVNPHRHAAKSGSQHSINPGRIGRFRLF